MLYPAQGLWLSAFVALMAGLIGSVFAYLVGYLMDIYHWCLLFLRRSLLDGGEVLQLDLLVFVSRHE
jgi:hypothetical protein